MILDRHAIRRDFPRMVIALLVLLVTGTLLALIPDDGSPSTFDDIAFTVLAIPCAAAMFYLLWKIIGFMDWFAPGPPRK